MNKSGSLSYSQLFWFQIFSKLDAHWCSFWKIDLATFAVRQHTRELDFLNSTRAHLVTRFLLCLENSCRCFKEERIGLSAIFELLSWWHFLELYFLPENLTDKKLNGCETDIHCRFQVSGLRVQIEKWSQLFLVSYFTKQTMCLSENGWKR